MKAKIIPYELLFKAPAGTSRGVLKKKKSYFIVLEENGVRGIGECGILAGLSIDDRPDYERTLASTLEEWKNGSLDLNQMRDWPSIRCGWEMALKDLENGGKKLIFPSPFAEGKAIQINGLVWMGEKKFMASQIEKKMQEGFNCIKLKIGAIDFDDEIRLLSFIRSRFTEDQIEIRVDANGAFSTPSAMAKLGELSKFNIHSIEQPIAIGQWSEMAKLCKTSPIPIALDEELIPVTNCDEREAMLRTIRPQYIILKPSLIGGFKSSEEWISLANQLDIQWWATSALESNIGLNAIAQWASSTGNSLPQGLGTGMLYTNNFHSPLKVENGHLSLLPNDSWDLSLLLDD